MSFVDLHHVASRASIYQIPCAVIFAELSNLVFLSESEAVNFSNSEQGVLRRTLASAPKK